MLVFFLVNLCFSLRLGLFAYVRLESKFLRLHFRDGGNFLWTFDFMRIVLELKLQVEVKRLFLLGIILQHSIGFQHGLDFVEWRQMQRLRIFLWTLITQHLE